MNENNYIKDVGEDDLTQYDDVFSNANAEDEFVKVPDGKYQVVVDRVELTRSKTSGKPMLKWELRILPDDVQVRKLFRNNVIGSEENVRWLKKDLYKCGLKINKISELPANLERLLDIQLEVTKRTSKDNQNENVYINKSINLLSSSQNTNADLDDIPF